MNRPLRLEEILDIYDPNASPIPISWPKAHEQKIKCAVRVKFEHGGLEYTPKVDRKNPNQPTEFVLFDSHTARMLERGGKLAIYSARVDIGTATLKKREMVVPAFRPWLELGQVAPQDDPMLAMQLRKNIQIFPGLPADELTFGTVFVTVFSAIRQKIGYCVEGIPVNEGAPLMILQP